MQMAGGPETLSVEERGAVTTHQPKLHTQLGQTAVQIFSANDRINQILIEHLDRTAWKAKPPGRGSRKRWHPESGIGKSCGKSAARPPAPAAIRKGLSQGRRPPVVCDA